MSHGKVARVFDLLFGIKLSRGASAWIVLRAAERLRPAYDEVLDHLKASPVKRRTRRAGASEGKSFGSTPGSAWTA